ncbi:MAG: hypothetical protein MZU91_02075 [Desulfosudis oleivorans]|nr:hypothetical protein [Desulfosudis oleivorans]
MKRSSRSAPPTNCAPPIPMNRPSTPAAACVMPGFVDPHTHVIWAGDRANEFEMKMGGMAYLDILAAGGGIISTVRAHAHRQHRDAHRADPSAPAAHVRAWHHHRRSQDRLRPANRHRTAPAQSPARARRRKPARPRHHLPRRARHRPRIQGQPAGLHRLSVRHHAAHAQRNGGRLTPRTMPLPFVDVFCENKAFDLEQSRQILTRAGSLGFPLKIHADEFDNLGGASLAVELGAASADHLVKTSDADIAALGKSDTVAVSLPCTPFGLAECDYTPARKTHRSGRHLRPGHRLQPRHHLERVHAVCDCAGLPHHEVDPRPGHRRHHHQFRPRHPPRRTRSAPSKSASRRTCSILSVPDYRQLGLSLRDQPRQTGHQERSGLFGGCGYYRTA